MSESFLRSRVLAFLLDSNLELIRDVATRAGTVLQTVDWPKTPRDRSYVQFNSPPFNSSLLKSNASIVGEGEKHSLPGE